MFDARHLVVGSPKRNLCGQPPYYRSVRRLERTWVNCPACQKIILSYHPDADPAAMFNHPAESHTM